MKIITMYTGPLCNFCEAAKRLLVGNNLDYKEIDISKEALKVAKINANMHQIRNKIKFLNIDIDKFNSNKYDLIISNPPYINKIDLNRLDDDVRLYEPKLAL